MKAKLALLFLVSLAAAAFTTLAFANNVVAVVHWWQAFLSAGGDTSLLTTSRAGGFIPWLDWSVVDYSAVTTLIPALGCISIAVSLCGMLRGRRMRADTFPFFAGSDQLNVALGLLGTLWGIIVIGYFDLDSVKMSDLIMCLHTALFSTLMAVVWVFMVDRPLLRPYFIGLLRRAGLVEADDGDLAAAVEGLVARLAEASDAFDARQKAYEEAFAAREKAYEESFERRLSEYRADFDARQKEYVEFFQRRISELRKCADEERAKSAELNAKISRIAEAVR